MTNSKIVDDKRNPIMPDPKNAGKPPTVDLENPLQKGGKVQEKKEACFFTVADQNYFKYALTFWKSLTKFHDPKQVDMLFYTNVTDETELAKLPKGIKIVDLTPYLQDQMFFYRQKPIISEPLLDEYDLVVGFDADSLILGSLDYILTTADYDVGTVINWNRHDEKYYPAVEMMRIGITPPEYFNCGLVALRSKKFCHTWLIWCFSPSFDRCQYKEQDGLNILCYSGNWNVRCFDMPDLPNNHYSWYGILAKGELTRAEVREGVITVPKGLGNQPFPPADVQIRVLQLGGGHGAPKDNWHIYFSPEAMERVKEIIA